MTDKQKEAIRILNRIKEPVIVMGDEMHPAAIDDDEYFALLEFVLDNKTEIQYVPQPTIPWTTPDIRPYYGGTGVPVLQPPYRVTCELVKD
jgi:hypothetical protein